MTVEAYTPKVNWINTTLSSKGLTVDFENAKVLELYGNAGQLLADPENVVTQENYTVFEYSQDALDQGIEDFPNADFRMWNHHNQMNNPSGNVNEPLPFSGDEKFDFIYCSLPNQIPGLDSDMFQERLNGAFIHLKSMLNEDGILVTTDYNVLSIKQAVANIDMVTQGYINTGTPDHPEYYLCVIHNG